VDAFKHEHDEGERTKYSKSPESVETRTNSIKMKRKLVIEMYRYASFENDLSANKRMQPICMWCKEVVSWRSKTAHSRGKRRTNWKIELKRMSVCGRKERENDARMLVMCPSNPRWQKQIENS